MPRRITKPRGFFVMNRRGEFTPEDKTPNQCVKPGHPSYKYRLKMMFEGDMALDHRAFILDHQEVDDEIKKMLLSGSCEEMQRLISQELPEFMSEKSIPMVCFRCSIVSGDPAAPAFLEFAWARSEKDERCLAWL